MPCERARLSTAHARPTGTCTTTVHAGAMVTSPFTPDAPEQDEQQPAALHHKVRMLPHSLPVGSARHAADALACNSSRRSTVWVGAGGWEEAAAGRGVPAAAPPAQPERGAVLDRAGQGVREWTGAHEGRRARAAGRSHRDHGRRAQIRVQVCAPVLTHAIAPACASARYGHVRLQIACRDCCGHHATVPLDADAAPEGGMAGWQLLHMKLSIMLTEKV